MVFPDSQVVAFPVLPCARPFIYSVAARETVGEDSERTEEKERERERRIGGEVQLRPYNFVADALLSRIPYIAIWIPTRCLGSISANLLCERAYARPCICLIVWRFAMIATCQLTALNNQIMAEAINRVERTLRRLWYRYHKWKEQYRTFSILYHLSWRHLKPFGSNY